MQKKTPLQSINLEKKLRRLPAGTYRTYRRNGFANFFANDYENKWAFPKFLMARLCLLHAERLIVRLENAIAHHHYIDSTHSRIPRNNLYWANAIGRELASSSRIQASLGSCSSSYEDHGASQNPLTLSGLAQLRHGSAQIGKGRQRRFSTLCPLAAACRLPVN